MKSPGSYSGKHWPQWPSEIGALRSFMRERDVRTYLEIGCRWGDTYHYLGSALPAGGKAYAIDLPHKKYNRHLLRAAEGLGDKCGGVAFGNSRDSAMVSWARLRGPFDLVFIDGDHSYEGVKADWVSYGPLGKYVAFHDIKPDGREQPGVIRLWQEIAPLANHRKEFLHPETGGGIGVLW